MIEILDSFARAGGGGSGGGGGGAIGILAIPLIIAGVLISRHKRRKKIAQAEKLQAQAAKADAMWSDETIEASATQTFYDFQADWSNFDTERMRQYLTPRYHQHISLMMRALWNMHRRNTMEGVELHSATLFKVSDQPDDNQDRFNVEISASAVDKLIDTENGKILTRGPFDFQEIWHFQRSSSTWLLDSISQITYSGDLVAVVQYDPVVNKKYLSFAQQNGFFYNADFGRLLLPLEGAIFSRSSFDTSDINHHVIGAHHGVVVQFFEYTPLSSRNVPLREFFKHFYKRRRSPLATYTIAHTTLPKSYGNILVERRTLFGFMIDSPYQMHKVSLEWPDFNARFDVYASTQEQATSLELLNPAFMEELYALPFRVGIQVVNSDLYLYTTDKRADYQAMLSILKDAFKEMKM